MEKKCGVYKIVNLVTGRVYVGSSVNIELRCLSHKSLLRRKKHYNMYLQRSWNKYGEKVFKFSIIEKCGKDKLEEREQYWVDWYKANGKVYNVRVECVVNNRGVKTGPCSELKKLKLSKANKGRKVSEETRKKLSESHKGYKHSEETRKKLSEAGKNKKHTEESKKKMRGRIISNETRKKMSDSRKGIKLSEETKNKQREKKLGIKHSDEYRKNQSLALTLWWKKRKEENDFKVSN